MNVFTVLYDLAISMLTADPISKLGQLTQHHCSSKEEADELLRRSILQRTMPGESADTEWGRLRIFMRNLVNRAQAPMSLDLMTSLLDEIEQEHPDLQHRISSLINAVEKSERLKGSLGAFLDHARAPGGESYDDWLCMRMQHYSNISVTGISSSELLSDLRKISQNKNSKIPNMGIALAANLFADLGIRASAKPDLHVLPTISGYVSRRLSPRDCIAEVIRITQKEASDINNSERFSWLHGGLYPRDIDRMIYLIGSDNFRLDGVRKKRAAPKRRDLMLNTLCRAS